MPVGWLFGGSDVTVWRVAYPVRRVTPDTGPLSRETSPTSAVGPDNRGFSVHGSSPAAVAPVRHLRDLVLEYRHVRFAWVEKRALSNENAFLATNARFLAW